MHFSGSSVVWEDYILGTFFPPEDDENIKIESIFHSFVIYSLHSRSLFDMYKNNKKNGNIKVNPNNQPNYRISLEPQSPSNPLQIIWDFQRNTTTQYFCVGLYKNGAIVSNVVKP